MKGHRTYHITTAIVTVVLLSQGMFSQTHERTVEKKFDVDPAVTLVIKHQFGSVTVKGGDANVVDIKAVIKVKDKSKEEAKQIADGVEVRIEGSRGKVTVETSLGSSQRKCSNCSRSVDVVILAPKDMQLRIKNSFGSITVEQAQGSVDIEGKFGPVEISNSANVTVENSFGPTRLTSIEGACRVENKNGPIRAFDLEGGEFENAFGPTEISGSKQPVTVESKMGSVKVKDVVGGSIKNSYGSVEVWLDKSFSGRIEAKCSFGAVKSDVPLEERDKSRKSTYGPNKEDLIGAVGGGNASLVLEAKFGDVIIRK